MPVTKLQMAILVGSPLAMLLSHAVAARIFALLARQTVALFSVLGTGILTLLAFRAVQPAAGSGNAWGLLYAGAVYAGMAKAYFHFFNMSETARRIRILYELYRNEPLSASELASCYPMTKVLQHRLGRLSATGQLRHEGGRYLLQGRTMYWGALAVAAWRRVLALPPSAASLEAGRSRDAP